MTHETTCSDRADAVRQVAEKLNRIYPGEGTGFAAFTCSEADALARMLALFGHTDTAATVVHGHSLEDDGGDAHGYIAALDRGTNGDEQASEASTVYVRRLLGDDSAQPSDADEKRADLDRLVALPADEQDRDTADLIRQLRQELGEPVDFGA